MKSRTHNNVHRRKCIALLTVPVILVLCFCWGCRGIDEVEPVDEVVESIYGLQVTSSLSGTKTYQGFKTLWRSDIGHMELGPESHISQRDASFWLTWDPLCLDIESGELDTAGCSPIAYFYSIENPAGNIGEQGAYMYNPTGGMGAFEFGVDKNGVQFVRGSATFSFERIPPAIGMHVPEDITVLAEFTATDQ